MGCGRQVQVVADLEERPVLSAQSRQSGFDLSGHVCRVWTLSTAASDAERERVCNYLYLLATPLTIPPSFAPKRRSTKNVPKRLL